jgi:hypothetical protein
MHHFRIVLAGKNVSGASHVRSQLVNFVVPPVDHLATNQRISKISDQKIVGLHLAIFRRFQVHTPDPKSLSLQPVHQVAADEAARTKDKYQFRQFYYPLYYPPAEAILPQELFSLCGVIVAFQK